MEVNAYRLLLWYLAGNSGRRNHDRLVHVVDGIDRVGREERGNSG